MKYHRSWRPIHWISCIILLLIGCSSGNPDQWRKDLNQFVTEKDSSISKKKASELMIKFNSLDSNTISFADRLLLAASYEKMEDFENAMQQLSIVPDNDTLAANARFSESQIAFFKLRLARLNEKLLLKSLSLKPDFPEAMRRLAALYDIQNRIKERNMIYESLDARSLLNQEELLAWTVDRRLDSVEKEYQKALTEFVIADSTDINSLLALFDHQRNQGRFDDANHSIKQIAELKSDHTRNLLLAEILIDQGDFSHAEIEIQKMDPDQLSRDFLPRFYLLVAKFNLFQKKSDQVQFNLSKVLNQNPLNRQAIQLMSQFLNLENRKNEAKLFESRLQNIDQLENLGQKARATLYQNNNELVNNLVKLAINLGQFKLAKAWLKTMLVKDPLNQQLQERIYELDQKIKSNP
ncbi:MAG: hypothetical protein ACKO0V_01840 [bacterium]